MAAILGAVVATVAVLGVLGWLSLPGSENGESTPTGPTTVTGTTSRATPSSTQPTTPQPTTTQPTSPPTITPVTLTLDEVPPGADIRVTAVVNRPPAAGSSYWLVIVVRYDGGKTEYYARQKLTDQATQPLPVPFPSISTSTVQRTAQIFSATLDLAARFEAQVAQPLENRDPFTEIPCDRCQVSNAVPITLRR